MSHKRFLAIFYVSFGICVILGCHHAAEDRFDNTKVVMSKAVDSVTFQGVWSDTLFFEAPMDGEYVSHQVQRVGNQVFWVGLEPNDYRLDIFSLDDRKAKKSVQYKTQGPGSIKAMIDGFYYHNRDTIFILSMNANRVYLTNEEAEVKEIYNFNRMTLPDGFEEFDVYAHQGLQNGPFYVPSQKTLQLYTYRWYDPKNDNFDYPVFASFSIEKKEFVSMYGQHPPNYVQGTNFVFYQDPILTVIDTVSYVQFGASEYLAAYNNNTGELISYNLNPSEYWNEAPKALSQNVDFQSESDWLVESQAYPVLIHDEDNKLIYRFLKHKQPLLDAKGLLNQAWLGPWSIEMFDYDLNRVGHYDLTKNTFLPVIAFSALDHLWVKNPMPVEDENISLFYRFLPQSNEKYN